MPMRKALLTSLIGLTFGVISLTAAAANVAKVHDGDTITTTSGTKVRFLQIDTPEISPAECYGIEAREVLIQLIGNSTVTLEKDSVSADKDQFGRSLRYAKIGKINLNVKLVELGAATPYFYKGEKGRYASQILKAAQTAKEKGLGLWKMCPGTKLDQFKPATTGRPISTKLEVTKDSALTKCDPNYLGCIPPYPPDLDCTDIKQMGLAPIRIIGKDLHKLDGDGDGIGCDK